MMGGPGRFGNMLNQETLKPRRLSETLSRLVGYFGRFGFAAFLAILFVAISTWTQVTVPELTGQATDCFLVPLGANSSFGSFSTTLSTQAQAPQKVAGSYLTQPSSAARNGLLPAPIASVDLSHRL